MGEAHRGGTGDGFDTSRLQGMRMLRRLADIPNKAQREAVERGLELGLEAAPSVNDRTISTFARGGQPAFAGINTFLRAPYCEDIHKVSKYEVAIIGAPFDMGTTYRAGARFGPQAVRRISALYDGYSLDMGCDLVEELDVCDVGDVFVIPSNIEKSFDQVDRAARQGAVHLLAVRRRLDLVAVTLEEFGDDVAYPGVVVDDQDLLDGFGAQCRHFGYRLHEPEARRPLWRTNVPIATSAQCIAGARLGPGFPRGEQSGFSVG